MIARCGKFTSKVTPTTAPTIENGIIQRNSVQSASRVMRAPTASAATTSSSTQVGSTNSIGSRCDKTGTVNNAAPKAVTPKMMYAPNTTAAAMMKVAGSKGVVKPKKTPAGSPAFSCQSTGVIM